jgi:hypothetical protein
LRPGKRIEAGGRLRREEKIVSGIYRKLAPTEAETKSKQLNALRVSGREFASASTI